MTFEPTPRIGDWYKNTIGDAFEVVAQDLDDDTLELQYYEIWHHEGRRARMGVMMMAPDYAWWHGFYECKLRFANYMEEANHLIEHNEKAYVAKDFPNANGDTTRPKAIFP